MRKQSIFNKLGDMGAHQMPKTEQKQIDSRKEQVLSTDEVKQLVALRDFYERIALNSTLSEAEKRADEVWRKTTL